MSTSDSSVPFAHTTPRLLCRHCGDPCREGSVTSLLGAFCCTGCESVFELLQREGLDAFYACEVTPGVSQRQVAPPDLSPFVALDDPAIRQRFLEFDDGSHARAVFSVPTMHCASCLWLIERLWKVQDGIVRADVDIVRRTVRVTFRPERITLRGVANALASIGYSPVMDNESPASRMPPARRRLHLQIGVAGFAFGNAMLFSIPRYVNGAPLDPMFQRLFGALNLALAIPVLVWSAADYFRSAWHAVRHRAMSLDVPIALGLSALFARTSFEILSGRGEGFSDSFTGLVFFLLIGRLFQQKAIDRLAFDRTLRSFLPLSVRVETHDTRQGVMVPIEHLRPGDRIVVRPSEIVPADATLEDDAGTLDTSFVTGESRPVPVSRGDIVPAGARVVDATLRLTVRSEVAHSRLAGLWNNPVFAKPKTYWLADVATRFGAWFTLVAVGLAAVGFLAWWPEAGRAVQVATAVLIIACPCAMTIAAPVTLGTAMAMLGRRGVYVKDAAVVLELSRIDTIAFDKTGTLTQASEAGEAARALGSEAWRLVRRLTAESIHPASRALAGTEPGWPGAPGRPGRIDACVEVVGGGLAGRVDGRTVVVGSAAFVRSRAMGVPDEPGSGPAVAIDGVFAGWAPVTSVIRPGIAAAVRELTRRADVLMLSGDAAIEAPAWEQLFGASARFRQTPADKLTVIRDRRRAGHHVLMVGDGLNDAGALGAADVGLAVSDDTACVVPACDAVIAGDRLRDLPRYLRYAQRARQVILTCFVVSVLYNIVGLSLALTGALTPLVSAILMPVSSLTIIGLSVGAMRGFARWELPS